MTSLECALAFFKLPAETELATQDEIASLNLFIPEWTPENVREWALYCGLPAETALIFAESLRIFLSNKNASTLLSAAYVTLYLTERPLPELKIMTETDDFSPEFNLILGVSLAFILPRLHKKWGRIPENVTHDTCRHVYEAWLGSKDFFEKGCGMPFSPLGWIKNFTVEHYCFVRLGRLEFVRDISYSTAYIWRRRVDGTFRIFAGNGVPVSADGFAVAGVDDPLYSYSSVYSNRNGLVRGNEVRADGGIGCEIQIDESDFECIFSPGMPVITMHIPGGGGLTENLVEDSLRRVSVFYPDRQYSPVLCGSWLFSPVLAAMLPPDSNIMRLQKKCRLLPIASGERDGLGFVFGDSAGLAPGLLPRRTSLQRSIADFLINGGRWRTGSMVFFPDNGKKDFVGI